MAPLPSSLMHALFKADENGLFANHLTEEIDRCHRQMEALRNEIAFANRCVNDLEVNMMINGSATESDMESQGAGQLSSCYYVLSCQKARSRFYSPTSHSLLQFPYSLRGPW
ncbi:unnamed protein product [Soboliphyme baturini]|uniref:Tektin n=1 Tax=Soboliphyme baturini TaxID=241478 RepID=A0A183IRK9_9BILA|nr:unnamed protein product [Soboliphyme baturini]